mgnify:CR=1 FL=1
MTAAFEKAYGIKVAMWRGGSEEILQRAVTEARGRRYDFDVVETAATQIEAIYREKLLAEVTTPVAADMMREATIAGRPWLPSRLIVFTGAYNTRLIKPAEVPKSYADLLDPKWKGKIVKAHPGYSGTIMTATQQLARDLGWGYLEKLAAQNVMQVQSASDPPKKLALGERAVQADGNEYNLHQLKEAGQPVEPLYAAEGTPLIIGPNGIFKNAPNPNAARLFQAYCFTAECQQLVIDVGGLRSMHPQTREKPGRKPFKEIKTLKEDAAAVEKQGEEIRQRYSRLFKV